MRILSIDGGGIKGVRSLPLLVHLEKTSGKSCHQLFDLIAGTSTGGIIAVLLALGYPAESILNFYQENAQNIFKKKLLRFGLFNRPKYSDKALNAVIREYVGEKTILDCHTNILIPAYSIDRMDTLLFKKQDYFLFDVIRATASAQTFFKPHVLNGERLIDGGNAMNNPAMACYTEYKQSGGEKTPLILSIGTGREEVPVSNWNARGGMLFWAKPTVEILMTESAQTTDRYLSKILPKTHYLRIDPTTDFGSKAIDDASDKNIRNLLKDGYRTLGNTEDVLTTFLQKL